MKLTTIAASLALGSSLAAPVLAQQVRQSWTLEGQQVATGVYATTISPAFYVGSYPTRRACIDALKERVATPADGTLVVAPPCLPNQDPSTCSLTSTMLTCQPAIFAVEE